MWQWLYSIFDRCSKHPSRPENRVQIKGSPELNVSLYPTLLKSGIIVLFHKPSPAIIWLIKYSFYSPHSLHLSTLRDFWHLMARKLFSCNFVTSQAWILANGRSAYFPVSPERVNLSVPLWASYPHVHRGLLLHLWQLAWLVLEWPLCPWDVCARDLLIGVWHQVFVWDALLLLPGTNVILN